MDNKYWIRGLIIAIALVLILLPFLQSEKDVPVQIATLVKEPPFPDSFRTALLTRPLF
jgi:hypothetical protein